MKNKNMLLYWFCYFLLVSTSFAMEKKDIFENNHLIRRLTKHIDEKIIDGTIVTACTMAGASVGYTANVWILEKYYGRRLSDHDYKNRSDDDIGWYLGCLVGGEVGHYAVYLRHKITDPLVPVVYNFSIATINASKTFIENGITGSVSWVCEKISQRTNSLNQYAAKKAT